MCDMARAVLALADNLRLPADEAVTQKYAALGRSGSGKSYAAMRLAELFLDHGAQVIALDWVGIWWSLRVDASGRGPGFEHVYVFGGEHADVPLEAGMGALVADAIIDQQISVVLDVMHFRKGDRTRFATAFGEQFFHRKKTNRTACHLFVEEAQAFIPQKVFRDEARLVGVFEDIGKVGRNYGIGVTLISQRPQAINKDVLNQTEVLMAFQTNGPQERKTIAGWAADNAAEGLEMVTQLPKLKTGHAIVWSPQWLQLHEQVQITKRVTYDASSTPTQRAKTVKPAVLGKADLTALSEALQATAEEAMANSEVAQRARIRSLERDLAKAHDAVQTAAAKTVQKRVEVPVLKDGQLKRVEQLVDKLLTLSGQAAALGKVIGEAVALTAGQKNGVVTPLLSPPPARANNTATDRPRPAVHAPTPKAAAHVRAQGGEPISDNGLQPRQVRLLGALVQHPDGLMANRMAILVGRPYGGGFRNDLAALRSAGAIAGENTGVMTITDVGRQLAGDVPPLPVGRDLADHWLQSDVLEPRQRDLLRIFLEHKRGLDATQLAELAGRPWGGGFRNDLSAMRTAGVIVGANTGVMRAHEDLFD
jgi:hypothetical protein